MRRYETIFIVNPDLGDDDAKGLTEKVTAIIEKAGGQVEKAEDWGTRKLAYEVQKKSRGRYIYVKYFGKPDLVAEIERNLRIYEGVIKYQTVQIEEDKPVVAAAPAAVETATGA